MPELRPSSESELTEGLVQLCGHEWYSLTRLIFIGPRIQLNFLPSTHEMTILSLNVCFEKERQVENGTIAIPCHPFT